MSSGVELRRWALRPELSCVGVAIDTSPTELDVELSSVELSCVAINALLCHLSAALSTMLCNERQSSTVSGRPRL